MKIFFEINRAFMAKKANIKVIGYGLWVIGMLLMGMPVMAQQQEWKSTSTMPGVSSTFTPNVQEVGAMYVPSMATTTTDTYSPNDATGGPRRLGNFDDVPEGGEQENSYPIGDAVLPMLMMAMLFAGVVYFRRKRSALNR